MRHPCCREYPPQPTCSLCTLFFLVPLHSPILLDCCCHFWRLGYLLQIRLEPQHDIIYTPRVMLAVGRATPVCIPTHSTNTCMRVLQLCHRIARLLHMTCRTKLHKNNICLRSFARGHIYIYIYIYIWHAWTTCSMFE